MMRFMAIAVVPLLPTLAVYAQPKQFTPQVGDEYEITWDRQSSQRTNDGSSSGSSSDRDTIIERVIGVHDAGLELEYDLPKDATAQERASSWQFPARVFKPVGGALQLLNRTELEARVDGWLKTGGWTRAECGRLIFTWNAFRIECDPQSVIQILAQFDLGAGNLRDGGLYQDPRARGSARLTRKTTGSERATYVVEMAVDPDAVRRDRAKTDVGVAEITGKTLTLDTALRARAAEDISGKITVTFYTDSANNAWRRTKLTKLEIKGRDGKSETETTTESLERHLVSGPDAQGPTSDRKRNSVSPPRDVI